MVQVIGYSCSEIRALYLLTSLIGLQLMYTKKDANTFFYNMLGRKEMLDGR